LGSGYEGSYLLAAAVRVSVICWVLLLGYCFVVAVLGLVVLACWRVFLCFRVSFLLATILGSNNML